MAVLEFGILGPLEVRADGHAVALGGARPRAVFAVLALNANRPVSAERLALALWGEDAPPSAVKTVQVYVARLRKALDDPEVLVTTPAGYRLRVRPGELDAERFESLVADGREALAAGRGDDAAAALRAALELWRGPPLAEVASAPFAPAEIARLEEQRLAALEVRVEADLAVGRHRELVAELGQLRTEHPWRERLHAQLMLALYRSGRQADALEAYRHAREVLVEQLGIEPGAELHDLHEAILAHDPGIDLHPPRAAQRRSGAKILRSGSQIGEPIPQGQPRALPPSLPAQLQPRPAMPFVGRAAELGQLAALLDRAPTDGRQIALVGGEPGSGKTRLAREFAEYATSTGVRVLYGACDPAVRTPYQPLVEALEPALAGLKANEPEPGAGHYPGSLTRLLPGLRAAPGDPTAAITDAEAKDPDAERHKLHAALTAMLASLAGHSPAVLVLDDVQWADQSSLLLLRHLARTLGATAIVVLALFREDGGEVPEALASTLSELYRLEGVVRVHLGGLGVADVQELVHRSGDSVSVRTASSPRSSSA